MLYLVGCVLVLLTVVAADDKMISKGSWRIIAINKCEDPDKYEIQLSINKFKMSRTEEAFNATASIPCDLDNSFSLHADISKNTDGGWKDYQVLKDECFTCFLKKYADSNVQRLMKDFLFVDPPDFPLPAGEYSISNYVFDYCELPEEGILGEFKAEAYIINQYRVKVGCCSMIFTFRDEMDGCDGEK